MTLLEKARELFGDSVIEARGNAEVFEDSINFCDDLKVSEDDGLILTFAGGKSVIITTSEWGFIKPFTD